MFVFVVFFVCEYEHEDYAGRGEVLPLFVLNLRIMLFLTLFQNMMRREGRSVDVFVLFVVCFSL